MSQSEAGVGRPEAPALVAIAEAAGAHLRAATDEDESAVTAADEALLAAATSAMRAGHSLTEIAHAEADGQEQVRRSLRNDVLRRVERSGRQAREAEEEHHRAIARAMRLGLSTREIAASAGVTHGTIRAITNRLNLTNEATDAGSDAPPEAPIESSAQAGLDGPPAALNA